MPFDSTDRDHLLRTLDTIYADARRALEEDNVLPASITFNGERVGITLKFRKIKENPMKKTICVDFDGVIHSYNSGWQGADIIPDLPVTGAIEGLHRLCDDPEVEVAIYSSRSGEENGITAMKDWLDEWETVWRSERERVGITAEQPFLSKRCVFPESKPPAIVYIDDRGIQFNGDWDILMPERLKNFVPWNKK